MAENEPHVPEHFKEVVRGSAWNLVGNIVFKAVSFFYYILVARMMSKGELDLFFLALGIISILDPLDDFGLSLSISNFIPFMEGRGEKGRVKEMVVSSYAVSMVASLALTAIVFWQSGTIASLYHNPGLASAIQLLCISMVLNNIFRITTAFQQAEKDIKGLQMIQNLQNILKLLITFIMFVAFGPSMLSLAVGALLSSALALALFSPLILRSISGLPGTTFRGPESVTLFKEVLAFGFSMNTVNVVGNALFSTDVVVLGYFAAISSGTVSVYSMASTLAFAIMVLPFSMDTIFSPLMANFHGRHEKDKMAETLDAAVRWAFFITIPAAIVFLTLPDYILASIFGQTYAVGATALSLLVVGTVITALFHPYSLALSSMRKVRNTMRVYIPAGLMFLLLTLLLTPALGMLGPCIALIAGNLAMLIMYRREVGKDLRVGAMSDILKMSAGAIAVLALMLLAKPLFYYLVSAVPSISVFGAVGPYLDKTVRIALLAVPAAVATALFGLAALLLRCLSADDVTLLMMAFRKIGVPENVVSWFNLLASRGIKPS